MANTKQARKRIRQSLTRNEHNTALRTRYRTAVKSVRAAIAAGDPEAAMQALNRSMSVLDSIARKKIVHRNKAARHKSRLHHQVKAMFGEGQAAVAA